VGDEFFAIYGRMNGGAGGGEWMLRLGSLDTHDGKVPRTWKQGRDRRFYFAPWSKIVMPIYARHSCLVGRECLLFYSSLVVRTHSTVMQ
jgi:hypothetical protein